MKESLVLVHTIPFETRVALIEDGRLVELFVAGDEDRPLVGNIVKGRVMRILPGMQAAFVDIGLDKAGFLYVGEIAGERDDDDGDGDGERRGGNAPAGPRIEDLLKQKQDILVQIVKAPMGTKGARLTNYLAIPGRHLVLSPGESRVGVSRKLRLAKERDRLRKILRDIAPGDVGLIARTAAENRTREELTADRDYLLRLWQTVERRAQKAHAPTTVYNELTMPLRVLRDVMSDRYRRILVDDPEELERVRRFLEMAVPSRLGDVELYDGARPMFEHFGLDRQLQDALRPSVPLKSGGSIVIEETEAMTVVDVNTGKFVGSTSLEETVLATNLEAVDEICRQMRLRNLGGILILDFIDMDLAQNRTRVYNALRDALRDDRARTSIQKISELGLVEMTRQRLQESLTRAVGERCPHCHGRGYLTHPRVLAGDVYRRVAAVARHQPGAAISVRANPWLSDYLLETVLPYLQALESRTGARIRVLADTTLLEEQFAVDAAAPRAAAS